MGVKPHWTCDVCGQNPDAELAIKFAMTLYNYVSVKEFLRNFTENIYMEDWPEWYEFVRKERENGS